MKINRLINEIYFKELIDLLYEFKTTDGHFHITNKTTLMEVSTMMCTCFAARVNFFMCSKEELAELLSSQTYLQEFEQEVISTMHYQFSRRIALKINEQQGPTKVDLHVNDSVTEKLKFMGLPNYMNNRNLDDLFLRFSFLMS